MGRFKILSLLTLLLLISTIVMAQDINYKRWNSPRDYEPIVFNGSSLESFLGLPTSNIFAYSYDADLNKWTQVALQIDDRELSNGKVKDVWESTQNNILDIDDEVIFMARDMGDLAPHGGVWIDNADSKNYERYLFRAESSIDQAYIYIYYSITIPDTAESYMSYTAATSGGNDIVQGYSYTEKHTEKGVPNEWIIPVKAGGNGVDILDRQKARLAGTAYIDFLGTKLPVSIPDANEEILAVSDIHAVAGKVRISRKVTFEIALLSFEYGFDLPMYYYPFSVDSKGASGTLKPETFEATLIRQSFDMNENAIGMRFYSNNNLYSTIVIDGQEDENVNRRLLFDPNVNFMFLIGETQGSIITMIKQSQFGNDSLYYFDKSPTAKGRDNSAETGDKDASGNYSCYGDFGVMIKGTALEGRFSIAYKSYFLAKQQSPSASSKFINYFNNPLSQTINLVRSEVVPVELASFEANINDDGRVLLSWITATESDNYGFEIQRTVADKNDWQKVGFVKGNGTTVDAHNYAYVDNSVQTGNYTYRIKQIDFDGSSTFSEEIKISISQPESFALFQNYPNPFNPITKIKYQIPANYENVQVKITIYNLFGSAVKTIFSGKQQSGIYTVYWDGKNESGEQVSSGTYVYRLQAGDFVSTKRMVLIK